MTREQKIVGAGAACGIAAMLLAVTLLFMSFSPGVERGGSDGRIADAARWSLVAALPLLLQIAVVSCRRFLSEAIDPTLNREDKSTDIDRRVAVNTTEQLLLFLVAAFAMAPALPVGWLPLIPAAAITFAGARMAFWFGYRIDPLLRAFGMAATFSLNLGLFAAALWFTFGRT